MKGVPGARDAMAAPSGADGRSGRGGRGSSGAALAQPVRNVPGDNLFRRPWRPLVCVRHNTGCLYTKHAMFILRGPRHRGDACPQVGVEAPIKPAARFGFQPPMTMPSRARVSAT